MICGPAIVYTSRKSITSWRNKFISLELITGENDNPSIDKINSGDWVTIYRPYAKEHGMSSLRGKYKILSMTVPAKNLFT